METNKASSQNKRVRQSSIAPDDSRVSEYGDSLAKKPRELDEITHPSDAASEPESPNVAARCLDNPTSTSPGLEHPESRVAEPLPSENGNSSGLHTGKVSEPCTKKTSPRPESGSPLLTNDDSNIGNESDSDLDYDDLDDIVVPSDADDFLDDDDGADVEDDHSIASSTTTISTGSVGSNTPSVVGETLESALNLGGGDNKKKVHQWVSVAPNLTDSPALRRSLFSNVPPTINFMLHNETSAHQIPDDIRKLLKWKLSTITPAIVKRCAGNSGFRLMRKTCQDWTATWGKHMKSPMFKEIKDCQKINHIPGTFNIGRKDRLWRNYHRLMLKFGKSEFGFLPRTFVLPADTKLLKKVWERRGGRGRWIVKPPALARGVGISVVNKFSKIPKNKPLVVQRYVARPYLINETKFDLRLYLLVTSVNPLRIYLYDDGLVRFASNKYSNDSSSVGDVYMHLTNYSINKNSSTYAQNDDADSCQGHKWTLKSLWRHFDAQGIDHTVVWDKIKDLMVKTVVSAENSMYNLFEQNVSSRYSCYELFGFDILLDSKLKPWLIEVNISPSLHSSSSLDLDVKSPLATEVFNMARYHIPNKLRVSQQRELAAKLGYDNLTHLCQERKLYVKNISKVERLKRDTLLNKFTESKSLLPPMSILDHLNPDDTRQLIIAEDELATSRRFERLFPTKDSHRYFKYFEKPRYYNLLLSAWEQRYSGLNRESGRGVLEALCLIKHHLKVPASVYVKKTSSGQQTIDISGLAAPTAESDQQQQQQQATRTEAAAAAEADTARASATTTEARAEVKLTFNDQPTPENPYARLDDGRRLSSGSEMDCGSVTPSPRATPEHPGFQTAEFLSGNSGFHEVLARNAANNAKNNGTAGTVSGGNDNSMTASSEANTEANLDNRKSGFSNLIIENQ